MKVLVIAAAVAMLVPAGVGDTKLGAGVTLKEATPIKLLVERPQDFVGKTVRVDGVATAVCEAMGCWMAIAPEGEPKGKTVRLKVEDGVIVFPMTAKGKLVSAEGRFEEIGSADAHGNEAAGEHAKHEPAAEKRYHIWASGAVIK